MWISGIIPQFCPISASLHQILLLSHQKSNGHPLGCPFDGFSIFIAIVTFAANVFVAA